MGNVKFEYTITFGTVLRIGYKLAGSIDPYTYLNDSPGAEDSPYTAVIPPGFWDIVVQAICPNCGGNTYSDVFSTQVNVLT